MLISPAEGGGYQHTIFAFLIDVGGEGSGEQLSFLPDVRHDATALTIVEIDLETLRDPLIAAPTYRVAHRHLWQGVGQARLYAEIKALAELWQPQRMVIDATGVGAGLASFLGKTFPAQVIPFIFTAKSKSDLGWKFLAIIETHRYLEYQTQNPQDIGFDIQQRFWREAARCEMEILPGPGKLLRWGVPDGRRDPLTGEPAHDDLLISAALCAVLEDQRWGSGRSAVIPAVNPLRGLGEVF